MQEVMQGGGDRQAVLVPGEPKCQTGRLYEISRKPTGGYPNKHFPKHVRLAIRALVVTILLGIVLSLLSQLVG